MPTQQIAIQSNIWSNNSVLKQKRQSTQRQNYMPFLFKSKRQFPYNKQQSPPVGAYKIQSTFDSLKGENAQPEVLKQHFQKLNQMSIFKSGQQRFTPYKSQIPGPASYNHNNIFKTGYDKVQINRQAHNKFMLLRKSPSCPAIPDSKVKYGYAKDSEGNFKLIEKNQQQIQKQKQKLKEYCSTLAGQNSYASKLKQHLKSQMPKKKVQQEKQILSNLEKYVQKRSSSMSLSSLGQKQKTTKITKPKIKLQHKFNRQKPTQEHLGPGCYNVPLDTLKKIQKNENFQFFSSSQKRFTELQKQPNNNPYQCFFNEKKNLRFRNNMQNKIFKKSFPININPNLIEKPQSPGPGYYEPQYEPIKKNQGNVKFGYESRFKQNEYLDSMKDQQYDNNQFQPEEQSGLKWGNLRKQKIKSPHKQFQPVKSQEIYGIMNQQPSDISNIQIKKSFMKSNKNPLSAVFLDKSSRLNLCNKTYYQGQSQLAEINSKQSNKKLWDTKGSFISKLPKKYMQLKENTPGPGAYERQKLGKKTFNIKNY